MQQNSDYKVRRRRGTRRGAYESVLEVVWCWSKWRTIQQQAHLANCPNVNLLADSPLANCFADCQYANYHVDSHVADSQYAISLEDCPSENKLADK
ncbi:hypothetical protein PVK06_010520 [Gossypium arboreum]|uniref:Uncharacterized protein n=1 Tax=Gossypium arboreum TaxID=29729 RepID=A0ABR0Q6J4_GOSAR|nr:hypothetical protein PVK06_010520 [Gossypium arboreum]